MVTRSNQEKREGQGQRFDLERGGGMLKRGPEKMAWHGVTRMRGWSRVLEVAMGPALLHPPEENLAPF